MKKDILLFGAIILVVAFLISGTKIQSVEEYYLTHVDEITEDSETVTLSIYCDAAIDNWDKLNPAIKEGNYLPSNGIILDEDEYVLRPGDTAFDLLNRATRHHRIQMEYQGMDANIYKTIYIQGINYLYEFSCGQGSGWIYTVNDESPRKGCDDYVLENGDSVKWIYTCSRGQSLIRNNETEAAL